MVLPIFTAEMNKFSFENKIPYAFVFSFSLPYELRLPNRHYYYRNEKISYPGLQRRERKVVVSLINENLDKQKIALRHSTYVVSSGSEIKDEPVYSIIRSKLHFMVESFEDEKIDISKIFNSYRDQFIGEIMQIAFEFFVFKYNESLGGKHFIIPSIYDCSHICFMFKKTGNSDFTSDEHLLFCPNKFYEIGEFKEIPIEKIINDDFNVWRYFQNYSIYSFRIHDYFSAILNAAISIESWVNNLIFINNLPDTGFIKDNKGNFLSLYKKINKLIEKKIIVTSLNLVEVENIIKKILEPRNEIMHGKVSDLMIMKMSALNSQKALSDFYCVLKTNNL
jgi:hypothetical protein